MNKKLFGLMILIGSVALLSLGCGQNGPAVTSVDKYDGLLITPEAVSLQVGATQTFRINGLSLKSVSTTSLATWEVVGGIGTIDKDGLYTATAEGTGTIEARADSMVGVATVTVSPDDGGVSYYPHEDGYSWVMAGSDGNSNITTFSGTTTVGSATVQILHSLYLPGNSTSEAYYQVDSSGVYLFGGPSYPLTVPYRVIQFPLEIGNTWNVMPSSPAYTVKGQVLGRETVTTPAGTFNCFVVAIISMSGTVESGASYMWLGKNAGIVKSTSTYSTVESLLQSKNF